MFVHLYCRFIELCWHYHFVYRICSFCRRSFFFFFQKKTDKYLQHFQCSFIKYYYRIECVRDWFLVLDFVCISKLLVISTFLFYIYSNFERVNITRFSLQFLLLFRFIHDYSLFVNLICFAWPMMSDPDFICYHSR